jgi:PRTRC genetic system protein A
MHILAPHVSCVVTETEFEEAKKTYGDIYIVARNGKILRHVKLTKGRFIRIEVDKIPNLKEPIPELVPDVKEEINFLPNGKIPAHLLDQIVQFFKDVMTIKKAEQEAMAHILYNEKDKDSQDKGYRIAIPNQTVSKASVKYETDHLQPGDIIALDIHSHNTMGAFFSGTDNNDDRIRMGYSGVVGELNKKEPAFKWRLNVNDDRKSAELDDIFDVPVKEVKVPSEWLEKVQTFRPSLPAVHGSYGPGAWHGWSGPGFGRGGSYDVGTVVGRRSRQNRSHSRDVEFAGHEGTFDDLYTELDMALDHAMAREEMEGPWRGTDVYEDSDRPVPGTLAVFRDQREGPRLVDVRTMTSKEVRDLGKRGITVEEVDSLPLAAGEYDANAINYGKDAAEAHEQIDAYLQDLEGIDELLLDLISRAYHLLSCDGQGKIAQNGI